jgi:outer membrane protein
MTSLTRLALGALTFTLFAAGVASAQAASSPTGASAAAAPANAPPMRIGFVNSAKILPQAPGWADAQQTIETETEGVKAQVQKMSDSLQKMVQDYQKVQTTLTAAQRAQREQAIQAKQQQFQQRAQQLEGRAQQHQAELIQPIYEQIHQIIEGLRVEGGYAFILDAGNQSGIIVAADTTLDLSDKVLEKLAAAGPVKGAPKPAAKPAPSAAAKPTGISRPGQPPRGR